MPNPMYAPLFQVYVVVAETGAIQQIGPKGPEQLAGRLCETINKAILAGKERMWSEAYFMPAAPYSAHS